MMHPLGNRSNIGFVFLSIPKRGLFSIADVSDISISDTNLHGTLVISG